MATYFVDSARADDAGSGLTWALAKKTIAAALSAASSAGDIVVIKSTVDHLQSADTTYTTANNISIIAATADDAGTAYTPTAMGETNCIGHTSTSYAVTFNGAADDAIYMYGLTFRVAGSTAKNITLAGGSSGTHLEAENCLLWQSGTGTGTVAMNTASPALRMRGGTVKFGAAGQSITFNGGGGAELTDVAFTGTATTTLITAMVATVKMRGCDLSAQSGSILGNNAIETQLILDRCKLHASATPLATQSSNPTAASGAVLLLDCNSGDTHGVFGYYDALGSAVTDPGIYRTAGAAAQSWKITTTANASFTHPFRTPWINLYNTGTSEITPYIGVLRDGSTTPYTNAEVWPELLCKTTAGSTKATLSTGRQSITAKLAGTTAADWTADGVYTDWTGSTSADDVVKIDAGAVTPAEVGSISMRVCVGLASIAGVMMVDPQIRT